MKPTVSCPTCQASLPVTLDGRYPEKGGSFPCPKCRSPLVLPPRAEMQERFSPRQPAPEGAAGFVTCAACQSNLPLALDERYPEGGGEFPCPQCQSPLVLPPRAEMLRRFPPLPSAAAVGYDPDPFAPRATPPARSGPVPAPPAATGSFRAPSSPGMAVPGTPPAGQKLYWMTAAGGGHDEIDRAEVWRRIRNGEITDYTDLCEAGTREWKQASTFPELSRLLSQQGKAIAAAAAAGPAGKDASREAGDMGKRFLAKVLDGLIQVLLHRVATSLFLGLLLGQAVPAGLEQLVADRFIGGKEAAQRLQELVKQMGPDAAAALVVRAFAASLFLYTAVSGLYTVLFLWRAGGTPGKLILGLRVETEEGEKLGWMRAIVRWLSENLSACVCMIGYLLAFFDAERRRTLHDRIASTVVVEAPK